MANTGGVPNSGQRGCNECALVPTPMVVCPICETVLCVECRDFWHPDCRETYGRS